MVLRTETKKRPSVHEKRRHGKHHAQNKKYGNTYWPYLPLALIVTAGFVVNSLWPTLQSAVLGYATDTSVSGLLAETNAERTARGVGKLALNSALNEAAQAKANDMATRDYWSHNTPDGYEPWIFFKNAGYDYTSAGENLAYGFDGSATTVAGWMGSTSHRLNLLNDNFTEVGFGIANVTDFQGTGEQTIVVAMYGEPVAAVATSEPEAVQESPAIAKTDETTTETKASTTPATSPAPPTPEQKVANAKDAGNDNKKQTTTPTKQDAQNLQTQQVSRVQIMSGTNAAWTMLAITVIAGFAAAIFILRHSLFWHRALVKGERFVSRHHFLDIAAVLIAVAAVVLTRTAGFIY